MGEVQKPTVLLPGVVQPAEVGYAALIERLEGVVLTKNLALYEEDEPPSDYTFDTEIDDVIATADRVGFDRFHLVGFSGGGAVALAVVSRHPERVLSLALIEPAWTGWWQLTESEQSMFREFDRLADPSTDEAEMMAGFVRLHLREGVEPPPPPPQVPEWMAKRPAGIRALTRAFKAWQFEPEPLRAFERPVYLAIGTLTNPDFCEPKADRLAKVFADFEVERWEGCHHFEPPHRARPGDFAESLTAFRCRAEQLAG